MQANTEISVNVSSGFTLFAAIPELKFDWYPVADLKKLVLTMAIFTGQMAAFRITGTGYIYWILRLFLFLLRVHVKQLFLTSHLPPCS